MDSVQINSKLRLSFQEILNGLSKSEVSDLERFIKQLTAIAGRKKDAPLSEKEIELIAKINKRPDAVFYTRYLELTQKLVQKDLNEKEQTEYSEMIPVIENYSLQRLKYIVQLAGIWNVTTDEVMKKLGITTPAPIYA